jgi:serine/threonine protein kinase
MGSQRLLYVVTEFAEENLSQIVPRRPLTPSEAVDMLRPVLDALAYLHSKGLVHGHLRPANIMAVDDQLRISSDRICAIGQTRPERSKLDIYDAPETATRGHSAAGDVWSLGVTLVEVLTQKFPVWEFQGQAQPELPATLPAPFPDVVRYCLQRDPQARSKITEIAARLLPDAAVPQVQTIVESENPSSKSRYTSEVLTALVLIVLALIVAGVRLVYHRPKPAPTPAVALKQTTSEENSAPRPLTIPVEQPAEKAIPDQAVSIDVAPTPAATTSNTAAVTSTAGVVQGEVAHQVLPDVPQKARDTIRGTLRNSVRVQVDPAGAVVGAAADVPGPSQYFADLATNAARGWKFTPAKAGGQNVASEWILRFEFTQERTRVRAEQTAP